MWERKTTPDRNADQPHQHFQELQFSRFSLTSSTGRWSSGQFCIFPCECAIGFERHIFSYFFYVTSKLRHVSDGSHHFEDIWPYLKIDHFKDCILVSGDSSTLSWAIGHMKLHITLASHPMYMSRTRLPREYQITLAGKKHLLRGVGRQFLSLKRKALYAQIPDTKL